MSVLGRQFHGARNQIDDTHVRPPSVTGASAASSHGFAGGAAGNTPHTELAFATNQSHSAWGYAMPVPTHPDAAVNNDPDPKHRGRVYEVEPARDQKSDFGGGEIASPSGYRILGEHHAPAGARATFPTVNWNAYKGKPANGGHVSHMDKNQSYMEEGPGPDKPPHVPPPVREGAGDYANKHRVDDRHPDQLNLFSGKTVAEHKTYTSTPGVMLHLHPTQFPDAGAFNRDPTTTTIRRAKDYHRVDQQFDTVR